MGALPEPARNRGLSELRIAMAVAGIRELAGKRGKTAIGDPRWNGHRVPRAGFWMGECGCVSFHEEYSTFASCPRVCEPVIVRMLII